VIIGANATKPVEGSVPQLIKQLEIADILIMEEKIRMLRERITEKRALMAKALTEGALVEFGAHIAILHANGLLRIHPFRGAILCL